MKVGLIPVSAKPYHAGHDKLVKLASENNDVVYLFVSTSDRKRKGEMTIYGSDMKKVWDKFIEPSLSENVITVYGGSPVTNIFKELEAAEAEDSENFFQIYSDDKDILKYTPESLKKSAPKLLSRGQIALRGISREKTVSIKGEQMRNFLQQGDVEMFSFFLPEKIQKNAEEIFNILKRN